MTAGGRSRPLVDSLRQLEFCAHHTGSTHMPLRNGAARSELGVANKPIRMGAMHVARAGSAPLVLTVAASSPMKCATGGQPLVMLLHEMSNAPPWTNGPRETQ